MTPDPACFDEMVADGAAAPVEGWDFSWFEGRAREERTPWRYALRAAERLGAAEAAIDLATGGGEVLAFALDHAPRRPRLLAATEPYPPNLARARHRLERYGATVVHAGELGPYPFADAAFDLVLSRHPVVTAWDEVARLLVPGGTLLTQQVGPGTHRELIDFLMGPQPVNPARDPRHEVAAATAAGLDVLDLQEARCRVELDDVGAVVHFLRKVPWTVPGFTVDAYRDRLRRLHEQISRDGPFVSTSVRYLLEARRAG